MSKAQAGEGSSWIAQNGGAYEAMRCRMQFESLYRCELHLLLCFSLCYRRDLDKPNLTLTQSPFECRDECYMGFV
jgi:hypothetical protein